MSDEFTVPIEPGETETKAAQAAEALRSAGRQVHNAVEIGKEPGMPLDTLIKAVRGAPLASIAIAFMVGVTFARRRN